MNSFKKLQILKHDITLPRITNFEVAAIVVARIKDVTNGMPLFIEFGETLVPADKFKKDNPLIEFDDLKESMIRKDGKWMIAEDNTYKLALLELNNNKCPYLIMRVIRETDTTVYAVIVNPNEKVKSIY